MKKIITLLLAICLVFSSSINVFAISSYYTDLSTDEGRVEIESIDVVDNELKFVFDVDALNKKFRYFIRLCCYRYSKNDLKEISRDFVYGDTTKLYGKNIKIEYKIPAGNMFKNNSNPLYVFQAVLHDPTDDWSQETAPVAMAWSNFHVRNATRQNGVWTMQKYSCKKEGCLKSDWHTEQELTALQNGKEQRICYNCKKIDTKITKKLTPFINLSEKSVQMRKGHTYDLYIEDYAYGDYVDKITVSSKKILSFKHSEGVITIKAKKTGTATISVKLKSGTVGKCKIKVIKDAFQYEVKKINYSTRNNVFSVRLKSYSAHPTTIYAKGAKLLDWDYKVYDRNVKSVNGKSFIVIKPQETKTIKFKLESSYTYPGYQRKTIRFKTKIDGETKWIKISQNSYGFNFYE